MPVIVEALIYSGFLIWMTQFVLRTLPKEHIEDPGITGVRKAWFRRPLRENAILIELESGETRTMILRHELAETPGPCQPIWIETIYEDREGKINGNVYRNRPDPAGRIPMNRKDADTPAQPDFGDEQGSGGPEH